MEAVGRHFADGAQTIHSASSNNNNNHYDQNPVDRTSEHEISDFTGRITINRGVGRGRERQVAACTKDKLASAAETRSAGQTGGGGGGGGGGGNQFELGNNRNDDRAEQQQQQAQETTSGSRRGLLEALIGDRARSWRDQKAVVVDIQNGRRRRRLLRPRQDSQDDQSTRTIPLLLSSSALDLSNQSKSEREQEATQRQANNQQPPEDSQQPLLKGSAITIDASSARLPTFGSVPQRLAAAHRLPYLSYSGRSRNVELASAANRIEADLGRSTGIASSPANVASADPTGVRAARYSRLNTSDVSGASVNSSRASNQLGSSSSSSSTTSGEASQSSSTNSTGGNHRRGTTTTTKIPTLSRTSKFALIDGSIEPSRPNNIKNKKPEGNKLNNFFGFSNISNLFPNVSSGGWRHNRDNKDKPANNPSAAPQSPSSSPTSTSSSSSLIKSQRSTSLVNLSKQQQQEQANSTTTTTTTTTTGRLQQLADKKLLSSLWMSGRNSPSQSSRHYQQHEHQQLRQRNRSLSSLHSHTANQGAIGPRYLQPTQATIMRRQANSSSNSNNNQPNANGAGAGGLLSATGHSTYATIGRGGVYDKRRASSRPASAAGNYHLSGGGGGQHRSPSTGSLLAGRHSSGVGGLSPSYAGQRSQSGHHLAPTDPDCPVHADPYETGQQQQQQQQLRASRGGPLYHMMGGAASQPDLLYEDQQQQQQQQQQVFHGSKGSPTGYSPMSPTAGQRFIPGRGVSASSLASNYQKGYAPGGAYYNTGGGKFSAYYNTPQDGIRSALAGPNEQIRRILGHHRHAVHTRPIHLHPQWAYSRPFIHLQSSHPSSPYGNLGLVDHDHLEDGRGLGLGDDDDLLDDFDGPRFYPFNQLQDTQAIRAIDFHPSGEVYAVGSNSRALRICAYPAEHELRHFNPMEATAGNTKPVKAPRVLFKFLQVHRGSIYCVSFNQTGQLLATGSNDQTVHIVRYNSVTHNPDGDEFRLTMHNGTIRDLCFIDDHSNGSSLLLSAGGGDNKIYVTDCDTVTPFQSMQGHTQMVMALHHCGGAQFVSGSYDRTIRFWDLRSRACTSIISAPAWSGPSTATVGGAASLAGPGAPVCSLRADSSGRLLASGHTDSTCMLYDIRGAKIIQTFRPHDDEIRAISFSPKSYYLLTGAYDGRLVVSDLQGDLTQPLPSVCVAESQDKIVQAKWHPNDFTFVSTSADKTATLWALAGEF